LCRTGGPSRSIELQNENTQRIIERAISSASDATSEISSQVSSLDYIRDDKSDKDSGFSERSSISTSSRRRSIYSQSRTTRFHEAKIRPHKPPKQILQTEAAIATQLLDQAAFNPNQIAPRSESGSQRIHQWVTQQSGAPGAPGAPGGDDDPPLSSNRDDSDNESDATARGPRSPPPPSDISSSLADVREQLERMSSSSSNFGENASCEKEIDKMRVDLIRLQAIMLNLRRIASEPEGPRIPEAMERQIEALFDRVRENCRKVRKWGDGDEIILRGRDAYRRNLDGETALHIAAKRKPPDTAAISRFLRLGASVQSLDARSATPLRSMLNQMESADNYGEQYAIGIKMLLDAGADANTTTTSGTSLLHLWCIRASNNDSTTCLDLTRLPLESLFNYQINVNAANRSLLTPLHQACTEGWKPDEARILVTRGANVHAKTSEGDTALDILYSHQSRPFGGRQAFADILLSAGAEADPHPPISHRLRPLDHLVSRIYGYEGDIISNPGKLEGLSGPKLSLIEAMSEMYVLLRHSVDVRLRPSSTTSWNKSYVLRELISLKAGSLQIPAYRMDQARLKLQNEIGRIVCANLGQLQTDFRSYRYRTVST
jgi:hypothetical protein